MTLQLAIDSRGSGGLPILIVTARNDAPLSLHRAVAGVPYLVIKGTGHWIHLDKPGEFNVALDEFLLTIRSR